MRKFVDRIVCTKEMVPDLMRKGKIADSSVMKSCQRGIYDNILWLKRITDDRPIVQFNADGKTFVCSHAQHRAIFTGR